MVISPENGKNWRPVQPGLRGGHGPKRPALRYHGGKWKIAPWVIEHFPAHDCYVEPYGGAASVLLRKEPSHIEVYNDLFGEVVHFFRVLRERPDELVRAIELTPFSREEFEDAQAVEHSPVGPDCTGHPAPDAVERARRLYVRCWQGRGRAGFKDAGGWRFMRRKSRSQTPVDDWSNIGHLWEVAARFKQVHIEHDDALRVIERYDTPETLFYLDPPYVQSGRCKRWASEGYWYEMEDEKHEEMAHLVKELQGYVVLSGYPSALYDRVFEDWTVEQKGAIVDGGRAGGRAVTECLWMCPRTVGALKGQLRLF